MKAIHNYNIGDRVWLADEKSFRDAIVPAGTSGTIADVGPEPGSCQVQFANSTALKPVQFSDLRIIGLPIEHVDANIANSSHFIPENAMQVVDGGLTIEKMFSVLADSKTGGFILPGGKTNYYVKGKLLTVLTQLDEKQWPNTKVIDLIGEAPEAFVRVRKLPYYINRNDLQNSEDAVFKLDGGGYFLNHERLVATLTERFVYRCRNPQQSHYNFSNNPNSCRVCLAKIT